MRSTLPLAISRLLPHANCKLFEVQISRPAIHIHDFSSILFHLTLHPQSTILAICNLPLQHMIFAVGHFIFNGIRSPHARKRKEEDARTKCSKRSRRMFQVVHDSKKCPEIVWRNHTQGVGMLGFYSAMGDVGRNTPFNFLEFHLLACLQVCFPRRFSYDTRGPKQKLRTC